MDLRPLFNSINDYRWDLQDRLTQKATNVSGRLGILVNYVDLVLPIAVGSCLFSKISSRILRVMYLIASTATYQVLNRLNETSKKNWIKKQIKQICYKSKSEEKTKKLVYIASSFSDSLSIYPSLFFDFRTKSNITHLAQNFQITFIEAKSQLQLQKKISELTDHDFDALILQAHGCESIIQFSKDYRVQLPALGVFETLANKLKANANISLISCLTGKGTDNIAKEISKLCFNAIVFAPNAIYAVNDSDSFKIADDGSCSFQSENLITSLYKNRADITSVYQNGQQVTESRK